MEEILHQLRLVVYPIIYRFFCIPGGVIYALIISESYQINIKALKKGMCHINILISSASHDDTVNPIIISNWNIFVSFHPSTKKNQRFPINIPPHLALGNLAKSPRLQSPLASLYRSFGPPRSSKLRWRGHDYPTQLVDPRPYNPRPHKGNSPERLSMWMFPKMVVTPKSSILIGISSINHPFWGTTIFGNTHVTFAERWKNQEHIPIPQVKGESLPTIIFSRGCSYVKLRECNLNTSEKQSRLLTTGIKTSRLWRLRKSFLSFWVPWSKSSKGNK